MIFTLFSRVYLGRKYSSTITKSSLLFHFIRTRKSYIYHQIVEISSTKIEPLYRIAVNIPCFLYKIYFLYRMKFANTFEWNRFQSRKIGIRVRFLNRVVDCCENKKIVDAMALFPRWFLFTNFRACPRDALTFYWPD